MQKRQITTTRVITKEKWVPSRSQLENLTGSRTNTGAAKALGISPEAVRKWFTKGMSEKNYNKYFGSVYEKN